MNGGPLSSRSAGGKTPPLSACILLFFLGLLTGCERHATPYRMAMDRAEEARRSGNFADERRYFDEAARLAKKPNDAGEAYYRSAHTWIRAGKLETGAQRLEEFALTHPTAARAARAWLDSGRAWETAKSYEKALASYRMVLSRYPDSGNALGAARRVVSLETSLHHRPAHVTWRRLLEENRSPDFDEALRYNYARSLEKESKKQALAVYEDVAKKHPLPRASYADEALLRSAEIRRELGDAKGALEALEILLAHGGPAAIVGSYTRTSYVEALLLKGLILRDDLNLPSQALEVFNSLPERYPHSRLVDDAVWEAARTEQALGGQPCLRLQALRKLRPESRYLRCEPLLCAQPMLDEHHMSECKMWLGAAQ